MMRIFNWKVAVWLTAWLTLGMLVLWMWQPFSPATKELDEMLPALCAERWSPGKAYKVHIKEKVGSLRID